MANEDEKLKLLYSYEIPKKKPSQINEVIEIISPLNIIEQESKNEVNSNSRSSNLTNNIKKNYKNKKKTTQQKIFYGRDKAYPEDLNELIQPLFCKLCGVHSNSIKTAQTHYVSKTHFKKIINWLVEWSKTTGEPLPKVSRIDNEESTSTLHCKVCDLVLSSIFDATQHYNGKRHKRVLAGVSKPSGPGYYDRDGNWVRINANIKDGENSKNVNLKNIDRFGIGVDFLKTVEIKEKLTTSPATDVKTDDSLFCELCNVNATSADQMSMHVNGIKHLKKLKNIDGSEILKNEKFQLELSMYRIPSGSFYCKDCNCTITDPSIFNQHLSSKKHLKKIKQKPTVPGTEELITTNE